MNDALVDFGEKAHLHADDGKRATVWLNGRDGPVGDLHPAIAWKMQGHPVRLLNWQFSIRS
jgi:hypothetical protein